VDNEKSLIPAAILRRAQLNGKYPEREKLTP
jgi:hypothetical protein